MELFKLLGKIVINKGTSEEDIDKLNKKAKDLGEKFEKVGTGFKNAGDKMQTAGQKLLPVSTAIGGLGILCTKSAADVKAMNSQFEQTFGDMQSQASSAMSRVAEDSGILQTRLQGIGTSIYAFAKASGADSSEAMALMETSLQATADAAAYYDRSLKDTAESLQSFLKGNFENDAALGLSCTETTRNAAAMELFGEKYNDLSEIQKQQTLLKMVTDAQELSGAMGQASREQDGLENVTGNLTESAHLLGAELGTVILPIVVDLMQKATEFLQKLNNMDEGTKKMIVTVGALVTVAAPALMILGKITSGLGSIIAVGGKVAPMLGTLGAKVGSMGGITGVLSGAVGKLGGAIGALASPVGIAIAAITALVGVFLYLWNTNEEFRNNMINTWNQIKETCSPLIEELKVALSDLWQNVLKPFVDFVGSAIAPVFEIVFSLIGEQLSAFITFLTGVIEFITGVFTGDWEKAWGGIEKIFSGIWQSIQSLFKAGFSIIQSLAKTGMEFVKNAFSNGLNGALSFVNTIMNKIKDKFNSTMENAKNTVNKGIDKIKSFFKFEWSLPKLKLPHFSISGSFSLNPPSAPSFGIEWYKKGAILKEPTAFGMNPFTGKTMAGGEAGDEAVAPVDLLLGYIRQAIAEQNNVLASILTKILDKLDEFKPNGDGDIIIPIYFGNELWDEIIIKAKSNVTLRSGGMADA